MATEVAQAYVQIIPSAQGIKGDLTNLLGGPLEEMGESGGKLLSGGLTGGLSSMLAGGAVSAVAAKVGKEIGEWMADAVQVGMAFDQSMSQVAATMGTTVDEIGELRDFAQEMGATTVFSAQQSADALNYMALAGYDAETAMAMLPTVLNLAAAGNMDLARASDMVTDSQSALGLSIEETETLVDQMAATASNSNTSVSQLGDAMLTVGGTAKDLKGGTQELTEVLGLLADNGIKGAEGGTHLRNMLLSLAAPTDKAQQVLDKLGVSLYDDLDNMKSLAEFFPELNAALDGLDSPKARTAAMAELFNARDMAAANALLSTSTERWEQLGDAIGDSAGAAERMAETQLDNLAGDITKMQSAAEGAKIAFSDLVEPVAREGVQILTDELSELTDIFKDLNQQAEEGHGLIIALRDDLSTSLTIFGESAELLLNLGNAFANLSQGEGGAGFSPLMALIPGLGSAALTGPLREGIAALLTAANDAFKGSEPEPEGVLSVDYWEKYAAGVESASSRAVAAAETEQEAMEDASGGSDEVTNSLREVASAAIDARTAGGDLRESYEALRKAMDGIEEGGDGEVRALAENAIWKLNLAATNQELAGSYPNLAARLGDFGVSLTQTSAWLIENGISAESWGQSVTSATSGVINSFAQLDTSLDMSLETMAANMRSNIDAYVSWEQNIDTLMQEAVKSGDSAKIAFVQHMQGMGIGAADQVAAMAEDAKGSLDTFGPMMAEAMDAGMYEVYQSVETGKGQVTEAAGGMLDGVAESLEGVDLATPTQTAMDGMIGVIEGTDLSGAVAQAAESIPAGFAGVDLSGAALQLVLGAENVLLAGSARFQAAGSAGGDAFGAGIASGDVSGPSLQLLLSAVRIWTAGRGRFNAVGLSAAAAIASGIYAGVGLVTAAASSIMWSAQSAARISGWDSVGAQVAAQIAGGITANSDLISSAVNSIVSNTGGGGGGGSAATVRLSGSETGKSLAQGVVQGIRGTESSVRAAMAESAGAASTAASEFGDAGTKAGSSLASGVLSSSPTVSGAAGSVTSQARAAAEGVSFEPVGYNISQGIASGISAGTSAVTAAVRNVISSALQEAQTAAQISSPSRLFRREVGQMIPAGMALGIRDGEAEVRSSMGQLSSALALDRPGGGIAGRSAGTVNQYVTMNIYGQQGQDVRELARIVEADLARKLDTRRAGL